MDAAASDEAPTGGRTGHLFPGPFHPLSRVLEVWDIRVGMWKVIELPGSFSKVPVIFLIGAERAR
eukprot:3618705-Alexandrium_andersonii.AAC.1